MILKRYLRSTEEHVEILLAQHELIHKLVTITHQVKEENTGPKRIKNILPIYIIIIIQFITRYNNNNKTNNMNNIIFLLFFENT